MDSRIIEKLMLLQSVFIKYDTLNGDIGKLYRIMEDNDAFFILDKLQDMQDLNRDDASKLATLEDLYGDIVFDLCKLKEEGKI